MHHTGDKPGAGKYRCLSCGEIIILDQSTDTLPPCPSCNGTIWLKL